VFAERLLSSALVVVQSLSLPLSLSV